MLNTRTLAEGDDFRLYHIVADDNHVYLDLKTSHFAAGYNRVMVPIPIHIWETIRHRGQARLDLVDKTDEDLLAEVRSYVDLRIRCMSIWMQKDPDRAAQIGLIGCSIYGAADEPREAQIEAGMAYIRRERQRQREIKQAIEAL
jgi:hypothetical protein